MKSCCENKACDIQQLKQKQGNVLKIVFSVNLLMFFVEFVLGWMADSTALLGDSLDMLGDAMVYGFSLYALFKTDLMRIRAAQLKGIIMMLFGLSVFAELIHKIITGALPEYQMMGIVASVALIANLLCLWLLYSHREDDINMRSTWICSRNDIVANVGAIVASFLVPMFNSYWPDVIVGLVISVLFLTSAIQVLKESFNAVEQAQ